MTYRAIASCVLAFCLAGCATPPVKPVEQDITRSRVYNASYDQVWSAIVQAVGESGINITTLEKDSGIVAVSEASYDPEWADEGMPGSTFGSENQITDRRVSLNILANALEPDRTRVQVNSKMRYQLRTGNGSQIYPYKTNWVQAYSNGTLEKGILGGIERRIH